MSILSSTLGEWHIFGCACLKHKGGHFVYSFQLLKQLGKGFNLKIPQIFVVVDILTTLFLANISPLYECIDQIGMTSHNSQNKNYKKKNLSKTNKVNQEKKLNRKTKIKYFQDTQFDNFYFTCWTHINLFWSLLEQNEIAVVVPGPRRIQPCVKLKS